MAPICVFILTVIIINLSHIKNVHKTMQIKIKNSQRDYSLEEIK